MAIFQRFKGRDDLVAQGAKPGSGLGFFGAHIGGHQGGFLL